MNCIKVNEFTLVVNTQEKRYFGQFRFVLKGTLSDRYQEKRNEEKRAEEAGLQGRVKEILNGEIYEFTKLISAKNVKELKPYKLAFLK